MVSIFNEEIEHNEREFSCEQVLERKYCEMIAFNRKQIHLLWLTWVLDQWNLFYWKISLKYFQKRIPWRKENVDFNVDYSSMQKMKWHLCRNVFHVNPRKADFSFVYFDLIDWWLVSWMFPIDLRLNRHTVVNLLTNVDHDTTCSMLLRWK